MAQPAEAKLGPTLPIPWPENAEIKTHARNGHCKKVQYEFEHPDIYVMPVMNCKCSIYENWGHLSSPLFYLFNSVLRCFSGSEFEEREHSLTWPCRYTPKPKFRFTCGKDGLTQYELGQHVIVHRFCLACGTSMGPVGAPGRPFNGLVVVNARTIDGVDLDRLELQKHDGRSRQ
ncbi:hypothetical protein B0H14DRAFT_3442854 [Mycena olivaceomarginata]|nr:hypothetical protein B0H14DRAFT_3442854 [Mycena olivaceomarginata]